MNMFEVPPSAASVNIKLVASAVKLPLEVVCKALSLSDGITTIPWAKFKSFRDKVEQELDGYVCEKEAIAIIGDKDDLIRRVAEGSVKTRDFFGVTFYFRQDLSEILDISVELRKAYQHLPLRQYTALPSLFCLGEEYIILTEAARLLGFDYKIVRKWVLRYDFLTPYHVFEGKTKWRVKKAEVLAVLQNDRYFNQEHFGPNELASLLRISSASLFTWHRAGKIKLAYSPAGESVIPFDQLDKCLELAITANKHNNYRRLDFGQEELFTYSEMAEILKVSVVTMKRWKKMGLITTYDSSDGHTYIPFRQIECCIELARSRYNYSAHYRVKQSPQ